jgi:4-alpha-glucanotransferase
MGTCLVFMLLFVAGTAPDVYKDDGDNWVKQEASWQYMPPEAANHGDSEHP